MRVEGRIVSYNETKKYGFIRDAKGQSYFFHISSLASEFKRQEKKVRIGIVVSFEPAAEPKGMAARKVELIKMHEVRKLSEFKNFHKRSVNSGHVLDSKSFRTRFYKSPHDAKLQLESMAKQSGANVVFDEKIHRETWSKGNYNYSMHQCTATVGIHVDSIQVKDEAEVQISEDLSSKAIERFNINSLAVIEAEENAILEQKKTSSAVLIILFVIFIIAAFSFS